MMPTADGKDPSTGRRLVVANEQRLLDRPNIILRNAKHFCKEDCSVANRHSYHGTTSPLSSPIALDRLGTIQERYIQQFRYPRQPTEAYSCEHIDVLGEQPDLRRPTSIRRTECCRKRWSANCTLSVLPEVEVMNTNDSLTGGGRRELSDDVMPRESDIQDSGHAPSSATITKRDDAGYHHSPPHVIPQGSIPIQGQVLVDPATGQHYIVPQAPFFPPAMQTMYFHHPPAVYYPYGQVQRKVM